MYDSKLIKKAREARKKAYAPYSGYKVGSALLGKSGKIYTGCNVENASFGVSCCAERVALFKAVSEGEKRFDAIAVIANSEEPCYPCGICRQALLEFSSNMTVYMCNTHGKVETAKLKDLLPKTYKLKKSHS